MKKIQVPDYGNMALTVEGENAWATPNLSKESKYHIPEIEPS